MDGNTNSPDRGPTPENQPRSRPGHAPRPAPATSEASGDGADRLTVLAHELGNLLDGSLRSLQLARRAMPDHPGPDGPPSDDARRRLDVVHHSLLRMAEIVECAMRSPAPIPRPIATVELGEAIFHAVDVLTPAASERGIRIHTLVSNGLSGVPAGPLYPVIVNGLANAVEAIAAAGGGGLVEVEAGWTEDGRIRITIRDDGPGLPQAPNESLFCHGFTTKPRGSGLGLSVASAIVSEMPGAALRLSTRADRPHPQRPGAVFEVCFLPRAIDASGAA